MTMLLVPLSLFALVLTRCASGSITPPPRPRGDQKLGEEQYLIYRLLHSEENSQQEMYDWRVRPRGRLSKRMEEAVKWAGREYDELLPGYSDPHAVESLIEEEYVEDDDDEQPVDVDVNMYLRSISKVDDVNMEYTLHFTFRQEWTDERLYFESASLEHIVLAPAIDQRIFIPDTFFQNEKDGRKHDIDKPNVMIRIYNASGRILYSSRMTLTFSCPMSLEAYPLDTQTCYVDYASYAYTTDDLVYHWKREKPVQIKAGLRQSLPSFVLSSIATGNCTSVTNTGTYSCLRLIISLKREFSYYLLQLYVPSFMLVAVSSVSFWLDKDSVPARVTLGTTVLLTVTTMSSGINAKLPPVSYTKSVDIWIGVCTGFIFGALLEFSLVNWAARKEACTTRLRDKPKNLNPLLPRASRTSSLHRGSSRVSSTCTTPEARMFASLNNRFVRWWFCLWHLRYRLKSQRIDLLSRMLFPIFFVIFNIIYWVRYLRPYLAVKSEIGD